MQKLFSVLVTFGFAGYLSAATEEHCFDVFEDSTFFTSSASTDGNKIDPYLNWQCAASFHKHKQLLDIGFEEGTLIYGVPLKKNSKWKKNEVSAWKDENCSAKARRRTLDNATFQLLKRNSPLLLPPWARCMAQRSSAEELVCSIEQLGNLSVFNAVLRADAGAIKQTASRDSAAATVQSWQVAGGSCFPAPEPGSTISATPTQVSCAADAHTSLVVMLTTDVASCWQISETETSTVTLEGKIVLTGNTTYEADIIKFKPDAELVTNGFDLVVSAKKRIRIEGAPKIVSFEETKGREPGADGRNAGPIIIRTATVRGSKLFIDNHGEDGVAGARGMAGNQGARGSPGRAGSDRGMKGCVGRKTGGKGGKGGSGRNGMPGGDAGDGGPVTVSIRSKTFTGNYDRIVVAQARLNPFTMEEYRCKGTCAGVAGPGGGGGQGGAGGRGGAGVRGSWPCGGVSPGMKGGNGDPGQPGKAGRTGEAGSILIL